MADSTYSQLEFVNCRGSCQYLYCKKNINFGRTEGNHVLSFEELTTLCCQVRKILNSCPIGVISVNLKDGELLIPAQLICGTKLKSLPTIKTPKKAGITGCTAATRWVDIQYVLLHFRKPLSKEYVTSLQEREKWSEEINDLKLGDVVFITDDNAALLQWPMGCITYVYSGLDNFVRMVEVKSQSGVFNKVVWKLRNLPYFLVLSWELSKVWENKVVSSSVQCNFWLFHKLLGNANVRQVCKFGVPRFFW